VLPPPVHQGHPMEGSLLLHHRERRDHKQQRTKELVHQEGDRKQHPQQMMLRGWKEVVTVEP
jgi:hypothetical protein